MRRSYQPIAVRAGILYFVICELYRINPMYQFSLEYFNSLFRMAISIKQEGKRVNQLIENVTYEIYQDVQMSLFYKHRLLFSLLMVLNIQCENGVISEEQKQLFVDHNLLLQKYSQDVQKDQQYWLQSLQEQGVSLLQVQQLLLF